MRRPRSSKRQLLELIEVAYKHAYGPRDVAKMTGYAYQTIAAHACSLGVHVGTTRPTRPAQPPEPVLAALRRWRIAAKVVDYA